MLKIPHSIIQYFQEYKEKYSILENIVDSIVRQNVLDPRWLFLHRIKKEDSFYFKLQTGRLKEAMEDFLACTIVVENSRQVTDAENRITTFFDICSRRPEAKNITYSTPEKFAFDDLRLYLKLKDRDVKENLELKGLIFEVQIKTFLQHAWSIATHDLIYKPKTGTDWAMARVAFQVRAMLEHAEVSIDQVERLAKSDLLAKENKRIKQLKKIENFLRKNWAEGLGNNVGRLAENILRLSELFDTNIDNLLKWINEDTQNGLGANLVGFSPYEVALESVIVHVRNAYDKIAKKLEQKQTKIFAPIEFLEKHNEFANIFSRLEENLISPN